MSPHGEIMREATSLRVYGRREAGDGDVARGVRHAHEDVRPARRPVQLQRISLRRRIREAVLGLEANPLLRVDAVLGFLDRRGRVGRLEAQRSPRAQPADHGRRVVHAHRRGVALGRLRLLGIGVGVRRDHAKDVVAVGQRRRVERVEGLADVLAQEDPAIRAGGPNADLVAQRIAVAVARPPGQGPIALADELARRAFGLRLLETGEDAFLVRRLRLEDVLAARDRAGEHLARRHRADALDVRRGIAVAVRGLDAPHGRSRLSAPVAREPELPLQVPARRRGDFRRRLARGPGRPGAPGRVRDLRLARAKRELRIRTGGHVSLPTERPETARAAGVLDRRDVLALARAVREPVHRARSVRRDRVARQHADLLLVERAVQRPAPESDAVELAVGTRRGDDVARTEGLEREDQLLGARPDRAGRLVFRKGHDLGGVRSLSRRGAGGATRGEETLTVTSGLSLPSSPSPPVAPACPPEARTEP